MKNSTISQNKIYTHNVGTFNNKKHDDKQDTRKQQRAFERRVRMQAGKTYRHAWSGSGTTLIKIGILSALALTGGMIRVVEGRTSGLNNTVNNNVSQPFSLEPLNQSSTIVASLANNLTGMYIAEPPLVIIRDEIKSQNNHEKLKLVDNDFVGQAAMRLSNKKGLKNNYSNNDNYSPSPYLTGSTVQQARHFFDSSPEKEIIVFLQFSNTRIKNSFIERVFCNDECGEGKTEAGVQDSVLFQGGIASSGKIHDEIVTGKCHIVELGLTKEGFTKLLGAALFRSRGLISVNIDQSQFEEYGKNLNDTLAEKNVASLFAFENDNKNCQAVKKDSIQLSSATGDDILEINELECFTPISTSGYSRTKKRSNKAILSPEQKNLLLQNGKLRCVEQIAIVGDGIASESIGNSTVTTVVLPKAEKGNLTHYTGGVPLVGAVGSRATDVAMRIKILCPEVKFHDIRLPVNQDLTPITLSHLMKVCNFALTKMTKQYQVESLVILEIDPIPYYSPVTKAVGCLLGSLRKQGLTPFSLSTDPLSWLASIPQITQTESVAEIVLRKIKKESSHTPIIAGIGALVIGSIIFFPALGIVLYLKRRKKQNDDIESNKIDMHELRPLNSKLVKSCDGGCHDSIEPGLVRSDLVEGFREKLLIDSEQNILQDGDDIPLESPPRPPEELSAWVKYSEMSPGSLRKIQKLAVTNPVQNIYKFQRKRENNYC